MPRETYPELPEFLRNPMCDLQGYQINNITMLIFFTCIRQKKTGIFSTDSMKIQSVHMETDYQKYCQSENSVHFFILKDS